ncbi:MAG: hypothetical protein JW746_01765 [Candidatus Krumholzibacteriota bacterium]|nr:hypothetical protein [Candidatus Krumholzibacteriota bacterium]
MKDLSGFDTKTGDTALVYRRVDMILSSNASGEVMEGDCLLLETGRKPEEGELALIRCGKVEMLCRWEGGAVDDLLGLVIGVRRKI